jgi:hypothetical protein
LRGRKWNTVGTEQKGRGREEKGTGRLRELRYSISIVTVSKV